jgi:hypothetical protein
LGTVPPGQTTDTGQTIVLPAVASLLKNNVNANVPDAAGVPVSVNVKVALAVNVAVTKFPFESARLGDVPVFPYAYVVSA